jgi:hypothetical protein
MTGATQISDPVLADVRQQGLDKLVARWSCLCCGGRDEVRAVLGTDGRWFAACAKCRAGCAVCDARRGLPGS